MSCPVCFSASSGDETLRASLNLGIFVLMGVTAGVLAGFLRFIISIARLSKADLKVRLYDDKNRAQSTVLDGGLQARLPI
jgi:hypothetical protein